MWTGENDSNTGHVDDFFYENREKNPHFRKYPDTSDRVSGSKSVVSPQLLVLNSDSRYMISRHSIEEHKDSCCMNNC